MKRRNFLIGTLFLLVVFAVGFILFANNKSAVHTPVRVGKGESKITIESLFDDLKSAVNNSDIVVDITISSWIGEEKDFDKTNFSADVNACLKGKSPNNIILFQYGSSRNTLKNYPLFDVGDRMIVFLKKATSSEYENAYYLIGEHTSIIDIRKVNKTLYAADRYGKLTGGLLARKSSDGKSYFTIVDSDIRAKFLDQIYLYDKLAPKPTRMYTNFFLYEELISKIKDVSIEE